MFKTSLFTLIVLFLVSCTTEKKHVVPPFVSNKKPDTHFFEQVIHKKNSSEVLFYFKFNYLRNEVSIYRPEHSTVGIEVEKRFSADSTFFYLDLKYFNREDKPYPEIRQKKGKKGVYQPFHYSDDPNWETNRYASSGTSNLLVRNGKEYQMIHVLGEKEDDINDLRYFVFDDNPEEQYFFRFKTAEDLVSYPKEEKQ